MGKRCTNTNSRWGYESYSQAINLIAGFASGHVKVDWDELKHIPTIHEPSISQAFEEAWEMQIKRNSITSSALCTKKEP